uniref:DPY30 domain containing 1 n=1 Tax=Vombatus ursinus TaxID=29139 RepID=A0A4X2LMT0_VOMUR
MESRYLQKFLGQCLIDPIEYLAFWLYKYKKNMVAEKMQQMELPQLQGEQGLARMEEEMSKQLKEEELLFQQQQLELEMQEKERQRLEELEKQKLEMEMQEREKLFLEELEEPESSQEEHSGEEEEDVAEIPMEVDGFNKMLAEISGKYGAPNLSRVKELDGSTISEAASKMPP